MNREQEALEAELENYARVVAGRDNLIIRAQRAGITKNRIHTITGISRSTIDRLLKEKAMWTVPESPTTVTSEADLGEMTEGQLDHLQPDPLETGSDWWILIITPQDETHPTQIVVMRARTEWVRYRCPSWGPPSDSELAEGIRYATQVARLTADSVPALRRVGEEADEAHQEAVVQQVWDRLAISGVTSATLTREVVQRWALRIIRHEDWGIDRTL